MVRRGVAVSVMSLVALTSCGRSAEEPRPVEEPAGVDAEEPADRPDDSAQGGEAGTVEEVLAAIAAMDLTDDERLQYLYERAVEEGSLLHYSDSNVGTNEAWAEAFAAAYPEVDHGFIRLPHAELHDRVLAEARAGRQVADVVQITASVGAVLQTEGLFAKHHGVPVPGDYPQELVDDYAMVAFRTGQVVVWNTDLIPSENAPRTLDDFLEPEHAGCVFAGSPTPLATMVVEQGFDATEAWLQAFIDNGGIAQAGSISSYLRQVASGEYPCLVDGNTHGVEGLIADGAPLDWDVLDPAPIVVGNVYIHRDTARPHAAALFVHWMLGRDGARVVAEEGRLPAYPDVPLLHERLQPFVDPSSEIGRRLRPLTVDELLAVGDQVLGLVERYIAGDPDA